MLTGSPNATTITIHDEVDVPKFAFTESRYSVGETNGTLTVTVRRYGDTTRAQTIHCVTISGTAREGLDFIGRRDKSDSSAVTFKSGTVDSFGTNGLVMFSLHT